jgi:hypothetical protein
MTIVGDRFPGKLAVDRNLRGSILTPWQNLGSGAAFSGAIQVSPRSSSGRFLRPIKLANAHSHSQMPN